MRESHPSNADPISQVAKSKLLELRVRPDSDSLYPLQLMLWAVQHGKVSPRPDLWDRQGQTLQLLEGMDPEEAFKFLFEPEPGERWDLDPKELRKESPQQVAVDLFQVLHSRMGATLKDYPAPIPD